METEENGNELNKLVSSALMSFGIFKSPKGNVRGFQSLRISIGF